MSAFLSSSDCLSALAHYWERKSGRENHTSPTSAFERACLLSLHSQDVDSWSKARAFAETYIKEQGQGSAARAVYAQLLACNVQSLEARYPGDHDMTDAAGYRFERLPIVNYWIEGRQTGHLVGLLRGYEYQACEYKGWETSIGSKICDQIAGYLLKDLEGRDCPDGTWASWEAPEDPRVVAMRERLATV